MANLNYFLYDQNEIIRLIKRIWFENYPDTLPSNLEIIEVYNTNIYLDGHLKHKIEIENWPKY